jgi:hypothetical protein
MSVFIRCPKIIKISLFVGRYSLVVDYDNHDNHDNSPEAFRDGQQFLNKQTTNPVCQRRQQRTNGYGQ